MAESGEPLGIALLGCGNVGSGVAKLLIEQAERLEARAGRPLQLQKVVVRDLHKKRGFDIPPHLLTKDLNEVLNDPSIKVVAELVGGVDWAREAVLALMEAGKDVVTANKALLAIHGREIFDAARKHGRAIAFEASVAGGIPIIGALVQGLAANQILSLQGILNGTCNFILTQMSEKGLTYSKALAEAQALGYAESDPTLDVDGTDAAHKLAIISHIAYGVLVPFSAIERRGISNIEAIDIRFARELGYNIKLLAESYVEDDQIALHVSPVLIHHTSQLAQVRGAYNAINVVGDAAGDTLYYGRGAGMMPTASAVTADLIDLAVGRAQRSFHTLRLWSRTAARLTVRPPGTVRSRYYLRLVCYDRPGVLADLCRLLADHQISISSVIQHEEPEAAAGERVQLVIMTHHATASQFRTAANEVDKLPAIGRPSVYYPVGD